MSHDVRESFAAVGHVPFESLHECFGLFLVSIADFDFLALVFRVELYDFLLEFTEDFVEQVLIDINQRILDCYVKFIHQRLYFLSPLVGVKQSALNELGDCTCIVSSIFVKLALNLPALQIVGVLNGSLEVQAVGFESFDFAGFTGRLGSFDLVLHLQQSRAVQLPVGSYEIHLCRDELITKFLDALGSFLVFSTLAFVPFLDFLLGGLVELLVESVLSLHGFEC
jgi:hypothetical protein